MAIATGALGVVTGPQIRQSLIESSAAFLMPEHFSPSEALDAALCVLYGFGRGSTTAAKLMRLRSTDDPTWPLLDREEAFDYMLTLKRSVVAPS